jgi:hypothetical protein
VSAARARELLVENKGSLRAIVGDLDGDGGRPNGAKAAPEEPRASDGAR